MSTTYQREDLTKMAREAVRASCRRLDVPFNYPAMKYIGWHLEVGIHTVLIAEYRTGQIRIVL